MHLLNNLDNIPHHAKGNVWAIGNFDGLHKGHRALLKQAEMIAQGLETKLGVLTFEPHPQKLFRPDDPPFRITPAQQKIARLNELNISYFAPLSFDWNFASQSAQHFVQHILINKLNPAHIIVGEDFCFGQLRKGTPQTIRDAGIEVTTISARKNDNGMRYSSSIIRQALREGRINDANDLLGWEWEMRGVIMKGDQRGRELGYPTANVPLGDTLHPAYGIYATLVQIEGETEWHTSATNIGIRPMFELQEGQVEAHILNGFNRDIYGKMLRIKPVKRLRGEAKFDSLEALCAQMKTDCEQALKVLT